MKNIFLSFVVIVSVLAVSCKKEDAPKPLNVQIPAPKPVSINVEYRITDESGNVETNYMFPNAEGKLETKNELISRTEYSVSFTTTKGSFLSVEAFNENPARKSVHVQILVDGTLFMEASSSSPSQKAIASGNY